MPDAKLDSNALIGHDNRNHHAPSTLLPPNEPTAEQEEKHNEMQMHPQLPDPIEPMMKIVMGSDFNLDLLNVSNGDGDAGPAPLNNAILPKWVGNDSPNGNHEVGRIKKKS